MAARKCRKVTDEGTWRTAWQGADKQENDAIADAVLNALVAVGLTVRTVIEPGRSVHIEVYMGVAL